MYAIHNIPVGDRRVYDNFGVIRDRFGDIFNVFYGGLLATLISNI